MTSTLPHTLSPQLAFISDSKPCPLCQSSYSYFKPYFSLGFLPLSHCLLLQLSPALCFPPTLLLATPPVPFLLYSPLQSTLPPNLIHHLQPEMDISAVSGGSAKQLACFLGE